MWNSIQVFAYIVCTVLTLCFTLLMFFILILSKCLCTENKELLLSHQKYLQCCCGKVLQRSLPRMKRKVSGDSNWELLKSMSVELPFLTCKYALPSPLNINVWSCACIFRYYIPCFRGESSSVCEISSSPWHHVWQQDATWRMAKPF